MWAPLRGRTKGREGGRELEKQTRILKAEGTSVKLGKGLFGNRSLMINY